MKRNTKIFIRTVKISAVVVFCLIIGFYFSAKAYENIRRIGFGEYRKAVEIEEESIKIFDFQIEF